MLQLGILMPRSTLYPSFGLDILGGVKQHLKHLKVFDDIKFITDNIGFGIDESEIYSKAEKMILVDEVDVVIVIADFRISEMLQPLFTASNKIMLVVNMGANFPDSWQSAPTTITHSLNFCFHTYITGAVAANSENKHVANVVSYYDAGYRHCFSMLNSNQANGGVPVFNHITHLKLNEFTLQPLYDFLKNNLNTKTLLCLFAEEQAKKFFENIEPIQKELHLNLFVSPMMFDEALTKQLAILSNATNAQGQIPWHSTLNSEENVLFKQIIKNDLNKEANYFALLGWESALLINEILAHVKSGNNNAIDIVKKIAQIKFKSPRGFFKIDETSLYSYGSSYLAKCSNNFKVELKPESENIEALWLKFKTETNIQADGSGWRNTYLCI